MSGYTRPFTPGGKAAAVPALPWQFAGDLLLVHFLADPAALNALLPPPLEAPARPGEAFLWSPHLRCRPMDAAAAALNPGRTHYNVAVIGIPCRFRGEATMFSTFQWGDRDWLVTLSWFLGACSKMAHFDQTGLHAMFPDRVGPGGVGSALVRTVSRHGEKIIQVGFRPNREIARAGLDFYTNHLPLTCMRHVPDVEIPPRGKPRVHDLTQMVMTGASFGQATAGDAELTFFDADNEELLPIQPTAILGGYWIPMSFVLHGIRVVHNYLEAT